MELKNENKPTKTNALHAFFYALNMRFNRWANKLSKRITCEHKSWRGVYSIDTGLFMYRYCKECGKKSSRR